MTSASYPYIVAWPEVVEAVGEARIAYASQAATGPHPPWPSDPMDSDVPGSAALMREGSSSIPGQAMPYSPPAPRSEVRQEPGRRLTAGRSTPPAASLSPGGRRLHPERTTSLGPPSMPFSGNAPRGPPTWPGHELLRRDSPMPNLMPASAASSGVLNQQQGANMRESRDDRSPRPGPGVGQGQAWSHPAVRPPFAPQSAPMQPGFRTAPGGQGMGGLAEPSQEQHRPQMSSSGDISEEGSTPSIPPGNPPLHRPHR